MVKPTRELDVQICKQLERAGAAGLTDYELEIATGRSHQSVSGNRRHLVQSDVIVQTNMRGPTASKRSAIKWVLAQFFDAAKHADPDDPAAPTPPAGGTVKQKELF